MPTKMIISDLNSLIFFSSTKKLKGIIIQDKLTSQNKPGQSVTSHKALKSFLRELKVKNTDQFSD